MAQITLLVCDVCRDMDRPTTRYTIIKDEIERITDLCEEHSEPIETILGPTKDDPAAGARKLFDTVAGSLEEIEELKRRGLA